MALLKRRFPGMSWKGFKKIVLADLSDYADFFMVI